ncbi:MAG: hypothetical protein JXR68_02105 [Bacteroidales bacterium]|nr:hypothetical protein [Bacteroidales bacterium]
MKYILIFVTVMLSLTMSSQVQINGTVCDADSCAIKNASVDVFFYNFELDSFYFKSEKTQFITNDTGFFSISLQEQSFVVIDVKCSGYQNFSQTFKVENDTLLNIFLQQKPVDFDINNDDVHPVARKPVIYLYPLDQTKIDVKLSYNGLITNTYPQYDSGWQVIANPNGDLINMHDNSKHRYLFWDGINSKNYQVSDFSTGFVVSANNTLAFLDSTLTLIGLNDFEKNDFITFWLPIMQQNKYNFVHFMINGECDEVATLDVSPKPDTEIRVYMFFSGLDKQISVMHQTLKSFNRGGFVLIEWGGVEFLNTLSN